MAGKITHVHGNVIRVTIPLTLRTVQITDGRWEYVDTLLTPTPSYPVKVVLDCGPKNYEYTATVTEECVTIEDRGQLPIGTYGVTVLCRDAQGNPLRGKADMVLQVVDSDSDIQDCGEWYEGLDGSLMYPILRRPAPAIVINGGIVVYEGRGFTGNLDDNSVTLKARRGNSNMIVTDNNVTITI